MTTSLKVSGVLQLLLVLGLWLGSLGCAVALDVPAYNPQQKEVTDLTGTLKPTEVSTLVNKLRGIETTDGTQIAVLLIPTLDGDEIFDFSLRVAEKWKLGQTKTENGILLVVAKNDRKVWIQVGYGLEGRLTDALSKRIITNEIQPAFRAGRFYEGIDRATSAIIQAVRGEYTAPPSKSGSASKSSGTGFWVMIFILVFFWINGISMRRYNRRYGRSRRHGSSGGVFIPPISSGGGGWSSGGGGGWSSGGGGSDFGGGGFGGGGAGGDW